MAYELGAGADAAILGRGVKPTTLSSANLRDAWPEKIKETALFSARTTSAAYLGDIKKRLLQVASGQITPQDAELRLKEMLRDLGYDASRGFKGDLKRGVPPAAPGSMRDLASSRRIQLILDTNVKQARSLGQLAAGADPDVLLDIPAWELTRMGARRKPRGTWRERWAAAGAAVGWNGAVKRRMVALKTSPIWQALADGQGGYRDTLGTPYPPFAFGSGMAWRGVGVKEWQRLCAAEGVPDGMDEIRAKSTERRQERPTERAQDIGGVQIPPEPPTRPRAVSAPFPANLSYRTRANATIDKVLETARVSGKILETWIKDTEATKKAYLSQDEQAWQVGSLEKYQAAFRRSLQELQVLESRVRGYGNAVETTPVPRDARGQEKFNDTMDRYRTAAVKVARQLATRMAGAELWRKAERRLADKLSA